ncbi:sortase domain-bontaining protein [Kribbella italica]|uniref:Class F sortase n=1 Tax=Kribbella italica TaxID=1540520 RepID=A0A7W9J096_9ACTN|nr:hypothetical protein [Kribbella italica]
MIRVRGAAILAMAALAAPLLIGCGTSDSGATAAPNERAESSGPAVGDSPPSPRPSATPSAPRSPSGIGTKAAQLPTLTEGPQPNRLQIGSADLDIPVLAVGVAKDGQMELPPNPNTIGWYRFGPAPGDQRGSVVLGGHLDSKEFGKGPLVRLSKLEPGDSITVRSSNNSVATYRVEKVEDVRKTALALGQVFDRGSEPRLRIVTCGGPYDRNGGGYRDNLVVTAVPV